MSDTKASQGNIPQRSDYIRVFFSSLPVQVPPLSTFQPLPAYSLSPMLFNSIDRLHWLSLLYTPYLNLAFLHSLTLFIVILIHSPHMSI